MPELLPLLKGLISLPGLSGYESPVCDLLQGAWGPLTDEIQLSRLGSLHALRRGRAAPPRPSLLLAAHMDAIGLMVSGLVEGFLRLARVGGLDARILPGQLVTVHGREALPGVVVPFPPHLLPPDAEDSLPPLDRLLVDLGLPARQVDRKVRLGDLVSFAQPPLQLSDDYLAGHSLDNRASLAALTLCLQQLQTRQVEWDVWAVATSREEINLGGAWTSAFQLRPSLAIAVDVTFGGSPGAPDHLTFPLDQGPTLGWGPPIHPALYRAFKELAERLEIPYHTEPMPAGSGTDADAMQISAQGIPTMVLSIPIRYMHSPVELVCLRDIRRAARLLAEFVTGLDGQFMERLSWDD